MSREMMLGMLRAGNTGEQILQILDTIVGDDYDADFEESQPTMEEIAFWCDSLTSGTQGVVILMTPCHTNNVDEVLMSNFYEEFVIAKSDEFMIVQDSSDFVHIMDGENSIRVSIPREIMNDLCSQVLNQWSTHGNRICNTQIQESKESFC